MTDLVKQLRNPSGDIFPMCRKAAAEIERLRAALTALYEWYDRDGSVGGADVAFEENRRALEPKP